MTKHDFIESYITKLQNCVDRFEKNELLEHELIDCILEVKGVFIREVPEIEDAIWLRNGTAKRDASTIIGILKMYLIDSIDDVDSPDEEEFEVAYRELKLEYNGIKTTIEEYTHDGNIVNYLNKLNEGIVEYDVKNINYCLEAIFNWYEKNILKIHSNRYVFNSDSHEENFRKIEHFKDVFKKIPSNYFEKQGEKKSNTEPIIFLSHKSDDKKYADALEKFITGLGVKNNQLVYTSHPLHKIPLDSNIYDYLRNHINSNIFMIFLWSDRYLESPACMNEMGAAWIIQSDYTNIYVPSFSFGNPKYRECAIDTSKMGAVLNGDEHCKVSMIELKNKIQNIFKLENDEQLTQYLLDEFINEIQEEK